MRLSSIRLFIAMLSICILAVGCTKPDGKDGKKPADKHGDHDHGATSKDGKKGHYHADGSFHADGEDHPDHKGDDDHPAHGPNHGHIVEFDSADINGEWCKYKDNDITRLYLLKGDNKTPNPMKVDSIKIISNVGSEATTFDLTAEEEDPEGKSAVFMHEDKALTIAIPLGVKIEIKMGDKTITGEIKAHKPLDH